MSMNKFGQIMDATGILGISKMIGSNGIKMDYDSWASANFCPKQGCVGQIVSDAYSALGPLWILECAPFVYVPVAQWAVKEISQSVFEQKLSSSIALCKDPGGVQCKKEKQDAMSAAMQSSIDNLLNGIGW